MTISAFPSAPSRADPSTFADKADAFLGHIESPFVAEINALETNVNAKEASAVSSAAAAEASKNASASVANASMFNNSTTYTAGQAAIDPTNLLTYRAKTTVTGGNAPSQIPESWVLVSGIGNVRTDDIPQTLSGSITFEKQIQGSISGNAGSVTNGVYTTGAQSIGGVKTFTSSPVIPDATTSTQALAYGQVALSNSSLVKTAINATGSAPIYACRAWVNFNGTGTVAIRASGNVSSITDNGTGDYTVNFTTEMPDINYCLTGAVDSSTTTGGASSMKKLNTVAPTTSSTRVTTGGGGANYDPTYAYVAIFR